MENKCVNISSRGILKSCDIYSEDPHSSIQILHKYNRSLDKGKDGDIIYLCSMAVNMNINILKSLKYQYILVTGDSDVTCPNDMFPTVTTFNDFMATPNLLHWYSQNCSVTTHPKLTGIPIGLDYHTLTGNSNHYWGLNTRPDNQETQITKIHNKSNPFWERDIKCYDNFTCTNKISRRRFISDRIDAIAKIPKDLVVSEPTLLPRITSWENQTKCAFVISPLGNGFDCHRTWEALTLGCIVIVKTSPIDYLYEGLPVCIVQEWSDVTDAFLRRVVVNFKDKEFKRDRLTLKYWMDKIRKQ